MTTITAPEHAASGFAVSATRFDRTLLRAASAVDSWVVARMARRGGPAERRVLAARASADGARREAAARAAIGILPR